MASDRGYVAVVYCYPARSPVAVTAFSIFPIVIRLIVIGDPAAYSGSSSRHSLYASCGPCPGIFRVINGVLIDYILYLGRIVHIGFELICPYCAQILSRSYGERRTRIHLYAGVSAVVVGLHICALVILHGTHVFRYIPSVEACVKAA